MQGTYTPKQFFNNFLLVKYDQKLTIKVKRDNYGPRKPQLLWTDRKYSAAIDQFGGGENPTDLFSGLWSIKVSPQPQVANHFHSLADIRYQQKSPGFACAAEISRSAEGCVVVGLFCYLSAPLKT